MRTSVDFGLTFSRLDTYLVWAIDILVTSCFTDIGTSVLCDCIFLLMTKVMIYLYLSCSGKILHIDFGDCFEASMNREKFPEKVNYYVKKMVYQKLYVLPSKKLIAILTNFFV